MHLPNNRGMFLESLLNYTIQKYYEHNIGLFFKRVVNIIPLGKNGYELFLSLPNFLDFKPVLNQLINCI